LIWIIPEVFGDGEGVTVSGLCSRSIMLSESVAGFISFHVLDFGRIPVRNHKRAMSDEAANGNLKKAKYFRRYLVLLL
jgi:hypothetical protein